ncbi:MAG: hypothetical protein J1F31_06040 [Erysipelotrichales bacterium]|nr:hypothetical protein [Erysipelotrichales bacterium]
MDIFLLISSIVLVLLYTLIIIAKHKKPNKHFYEISTKPSILYNILLNFLYGCNMLLLIIFVIASFSKVMPTEEFSFTIGFVVSCVIILVLLCCNYFVYAGIKENKVYVHTVFKTKIIPIGDIKHIKEVLHFSIKFYDINHKTLFVLGSDFFKSGDVVLFIKNKKQEETDYVCNIIENKVYSEYNFLDSNDEKRLISLGQEYRNNFEKFRKQYIIINLIVALLVVLIFCGLSIVAKSVVYGLCFALPFIIIDFILVRRKLKQMAAELNKDDKFLGLKYRFRFKNIKGEHKNIIHKITNYCVLGIIVTGVFASFTAMFRNTPYDYEDLTTITYEMKSFEKKENRNRFSITFNNNIEYDLPAFNVKNFDYSFIDEVEEGDLVTLLIKESNYKVHIGKDDIYTYTYFYGVNANGKDYFTYDDYIKGFNDFYVGDDMLYYELGVSIALGLIILVSYIVFKSKEKNETVGI